MSPRLIFSRCSVGCVWRAVFVALFAGMVAGPGTAQSWGQWQQTHKLTAAKAAAEDYFGLSVSISRGIVIVGAWWDDDACPSDPECNSGSAHVFDVSTGQQLYELTADDAVAGRGFGICVSTSGGIALVGVQYDDSAGTSSGAAYLFDVATGQQLHKLTAEDASVGDAFGRSASINDGVALVGALFDNDAGPNSGSAYLFDVATGQQLHKLTADDAAAQDLFGRSVSIDDGIALVGSIWDDDMGNVSGSAYLFDVATGQQLHKLTADDAAAGDGFGGSVALGGGTAIVGATGNDDAGQLSGSAYLFDVATGRQLHKLTADDATEHDGFGYSVAVSGDMAIIGARRDGDACPKNPFCWSGSAYLFDVTTGEQLQKLTADDAAQGDSFGYSVGFSGDIAIIGAFGDDDACPEDPDCSSGSAYVFAPSDPCGDKDGDGRVTICHIPPGNPERARTISVSVNAVPAHLEHGDYCGPCQE